MDLRFLIRSVNRIRRGNPRNRNRNVFEVLGGVEEERGFRVRGFLKLKWCVWTVRVRDRSRVFFLFFLLSVCEEFGGKKKREKGVWGFGELMVLVVGIEVGKGENARLCCMGGLVRKGNGLGTCGQSPRVRS